ncbi:hypothetical protein [Haliangium sp.]|uniref:hypothetical protein n=1 Tax=Haliangium sp. TaxID=2663208 RepID=UPI003D0C223E
MSDHRTSKSVFHSLLRGMVVVGGLATIIGCGQPGMTFRTIQSAAEPYQVYIKGPSDEVPARLSAATGLNLRFIAAAGDVDFAIQVYAPVSADGTTSKIWEHRFHYETGHQSWEIVISADEGQEFIQIVPSTWEAARASLVHLPAQVEGPDRVQGPDAPEQASPRYRLYRRR